MPMAHFVWSAWGINSQNSDSENYYFIISQHVRENKRYIEIYIKRQSEMLQIALLLNKNPNWFVI